MASRSGARARPRRASITAAVLACLVVGVLLLREPIGRWIFPDAALAGLLAQAEQALDGNDTRTAAARFLAAQARAPDHPRVVDGLARTRDRLLLQAERAVAEGDAAIAGESLDQARALGASPERVEALRRTLVEKSAPSTEALLQQAASIEGSDADAALALYRDVLARAPGDAVARAGRGRLLAARLAEAGRALDAGDTARAAMLVDAVRRIDPAHLQLPELEMRLGARGIRLPEVAAGDVDVVAESVEAARWRGLAEEAIGRGAIDDARRALAKARELSPEAPELEALEERLERAAAGLSEVR